MRLTQLFAGAALAAAALFSAAPASAQPGDDPVSIEVNPSDAALDLGQTVGLTVTITNNTDATIDDLVAHIDVTSAETDGSVDPEDWSEVLTMPVGSLAGGTSTSLDWTIQPISAGQFLVYAVALNPDRVPVEGSNLMTVNVTDRRTLNSQGMLPVSILVPAAIGGLLVIQLRRRRRTD